MKHTRRISFAALVLVACNQVSSGNLKTNAIQAVFTVNANGTATEVAATLMSGSNYVTLSNGDELEVAVDGATDQLSESASLFGQVAYGAEVGDITPGALFTIAFNRPSNQTSAPDTKATLPSDFNITSTASATYSISTNPITITWDTTPASGESMAWSASGPCIVSNSGELQDPTTSLTINPGTLALATGTGDGGTSETTCAVTINVMRSNSGTIDPNFASGSSVEGFQTRTTTIQVSM